LRGYGRGYGQKYGRNSKCMDNGDSQHESPTGFVKRRYCWSVCWSVHQRRYILREVVQQPSLLEDRVMSMRPKPIGPVAADTARVARVAFPKGTTYVQMRDVLGAIYEDEDFAELFEARGSPAIAPWRLALVTVKKPQGACRDRCFAQDLGAAIRRRERRRTAWSGKPKLDLRREVCAHD
jgi:hypothetical protein